MTTTKARLAKVLSLLAHEVEDVAVLAKSQRQNADKQHENAHKLEVIKEALDVSAAEIKAELKTI